MSTTKERSTVIERYTKPEMGHIWTEHNEWDTMKQVEILASEAQAELGNIPKEAAKEIREKLLFLSTASMKSKRKHIMTLRLSSRRFRKTSVKPANMYTSA